MRAHQRFLTPICTAVVLAAAVATAPARAMGVVDVRSATTSTGQTPRGAQPTAAAAAAKAADDIQHDYRSLLLVVAAMLLAARNIAARMD